MGEPKIEIIIFIAFIVMGLAVSIFACCRSAGKDDERNGRK